MNEAERFPIERLSQFTGETVERLREWRDRGLVGRSESDDFQPVDIERARIVQLAIKRGIPMDIIEKSRMFYDETLQRDDNPLFEGRVYSLEEAAEAVRQDSGALGRLVEDAGIDSVCLSEDHACRARPAGRAHCELDSPASSTTTPCVPSTVMV